MRKLIYCLVAMVAASVMISCEKVEEAFKQFEVYITCEEGVISPTYYYNQIPLWTIGYSQNNNCGLTPYDDEAFKFVAY